ncbi:hypothetical protein BEP19_12985 [Ammoniphilus oxalaticus]|uniref:Carnitine transport ATP-binding protein OpuCA n=1 Tax=Ammoniphilus oxalaticus TaxID=66863 RepID=A0A419SH70_9BACL|nr:ABC transporter ATP-binding protein [Ammoniphilus oxalaticus]RKD23128.1 hypothetical protein BEP19_12985 [Ammoniphilus oxalaticus]
MFELQISNLNKTFQNVQALHQVNLEVSAGHMLAVLGPSGCGKTTLLRCIAGFEIPDSGEIRLGGKKVFGDGLNLPPEKRRVGYVPQEGALFPHITVAQNIAFGLPRREKRSKRIDEMLELVGLPGLGERMPHELSGGQQQRVALARALAPSPSLVLLDEPFSALDAGLRATLREDVKTALKEINATAVLVTHDQEEALSMADVIAVMRSGACIQTSDPVTLYKYPADIDVATFIGEATILEAAVCDGNIVECPLGDLLPVAETCLKNCDKAVIMIRPEQFVIGKPANGTVSGRVLKTTFFGHDSLVHLQLDDHLGGHEIQVRLLGTHHYQPGEPIGLKINGEVMAYPVMS